VFTNVITTVCEKVANSVGFVYGPCIRLHERVHGRYTAVNTGRVYGQYTAVYTAQHTAVYMVVYMDKIITKLQCTLFQ